ncbi:MAG: hypothetical protein ACJ79X_05495 [Gemmatimonadaceae bacterium]
MKSRYFWAFFFGALVLGVSANAQQTSDRPAVPPASAATGAKPAAAVGKGSAAADSARAADALPLRFETSWGSADIIRGADGPVLGTVGWFRGFDVEKLVESSPRAVTEARRFQTANFRGSLVSSIGAATVGIGILVAGSNANNASTPIIIIAGAGAIGWGLQHINTGYAALSKALWWYNQEQAR